MIERFDLNITNYKFVALIIIASYSRDYLINEELFANTGGDCKSSLRCSIKPPRIQLTGVTTFLAEGGLQLLEQRSCHATGL